MSVTTERIENLESLRKENSAKDWKKQRPIMGEKAAKLFIQNAVTRHGFKSAKQLDTALTKVNMLRMGVLNKAGMQVVEEELKEALSQSDSTLTTLYDAYHEILNINVEYNRSGRLMDVNGAEYLSYMVMQSEDI